MPVPLVLRDRINQLSDDLWHCMPGTATDPFERLAAITALCQDNALSRTPTGAQARDGGEEFVAATAKHGPRARGPDSSSIARAIAQWR